MSDANEVDRLWGESMAQCIAWEREKVSEALATIEELELAWKTGDYAWAREMGAISQSLLESLEAAHRRAEAA